MKYLFLPIATLFLSAMITMAREPQTTVTFQAGDFTVSTLSEGGGQGNTNLLKGATPDQLKKYLPDGTFPLETQVFLVRTPDQNVMIDAGHGRNLFKNLHTLGLDETKINVILLTHMHGDHIGGLLREGVPAFPNAELYLSKKEYDYWMNLGERGASQQKVLKAYKAKLHTFEPGTVDNLGKELLKGITPIAAYGHTPGHTAFYVRSADAKWLIWGDLTHAMPIQIPCPEVALSFDVNPDEAIKARKLLLEFIVKNGVTAGGMHVPFPSVGTLKTASDGYSYTPKCLCEEIYN
jgi:glyoxylase-like metal-dependent hydrolase (beta-lactamase superfamily II)